MNMGDTVEKRGLTVKLEGGYVVQLHGNLQLAAFVSLTRPST